VEYRTDPARVAELLPAPLEPAPDDPGAVALIWADWQSCAHDGAELLRSSVSGASSSVSGASSSVSGASSGVSGASSGGAGGR
jgi:hypothetical protein